MNRAIAKLISTDQTHQIPSIVQTNRQEGMQLMDQCLLEAVQAKQIDPDDAYLYAASKRPFERFVTDRSLLPVAAGAEPERS
jgi:twitching motility protein PilT